MDQDTFWKLVDSSRHDARGDVEAQAEALESRLSRLPAGEIVEFARMFRELWVRAYTWDLWGVAYLVDGGCSDDGFMDFRSWLISKGRKVYEAALADPDSLADFITEDDTETGCQAESFQYAAGRAWEAKTGGEYSDFPSVGPEQPAEPKGEQWDEDADELARRFPHVAAKFQ